MKRIGVSLAVLVVAIFAITAMSAAKDILGICSSDQHRQLTTSSVDEVGGI